jgi:peptide/nickel transport system permease protein
MVDARLSAASPDAMPPKTPGLLARALDSDIWASFTRSKLTMAATAVTILFFLAALLAGFVSPQNPFNPAELELINSRLPPLWASEGQRPFVLGTDDQGRDMFSAILYGLRISLLVGFMGVAFAATLGITLGLLAGYLGGITDAVIMRIADVQLTFPAILIALIVDGVAKAVLGGHLDPGTTLSVLVFSIGLSFWVQYARTVRGSVLVEKNKDYVAAARLIGLPAPVIMCRHVLPNVLGPRARHRHDQPRAAIITEATLSFLGSGMPDTMPSLGHPHPDREQLPVLRRVVDRRPSPASASRS